MTINPLLEQAVTWFNPALIREEIAFWLHAGGEHYTGLLKSIRLDNTGGMILEYSWSLRVLPQKRFCITFWRPVLGGMIGNGTIRLLAPKISRQFTNEHTEILDGEDVVDLYRSAKRVRQTKEIWASLK